MTMTAKRRGRLARRRDRSSSTLMVPWVFVMALEMTRAGMCEAFVLPRNIGSITSFNRFGNDFFISPTSGPNSVESTPPGMKRSNLFPNRKSDDFAPEARKKSSEINSLKDYSIEAEATNKERGADQTKSEEPLPSVDDLNRNLDLLRRELEAKSQRFRQTVLDLQKESERTLTSVQQWDEYYQARMNELSNKAELDQENLPSQEPPKGSASNKSGRSASERVYWLAEQLQRAKSQTQQSQLESELEAKNDALQLKVASLQQEVERQQRQTESEKARYEQLWRYRLALETEVAEIQSKLQQSIQNLKDRLDSEMKQRLVDKQVHDAELKNRDVEYEQKLRDIQRQSMEATASLTNRLHAKDVQYNQAIQHAASEHSTEDATEAKKMHEAEKAHLTELLRQKEQDLVRQVELTNAAQEKATAQWAKRSELEKELAKVKHEYEASVKEWNSRSETLAQARKTELESLRRLLTQKDSESNDRVRALTDEVEAKNLQLEESLKARDAQHAQVIHEIQQTSELEKKKLHEDVEAIRRELERYRTDTDARLKAEKEAHERKQLELMSEIAQNKQELSKQRSTSSSSEETAKLQLEKQKELDRQLAELKRQHDVSIAEWELRLKAIQQERSSEQLRMEAKLAQAQEHAREEVESIRREATRRQSELELQIGVRKEEHRVALQKVSDESRIQVSEMKQKAALLANELHQQKMESDRQLAAMKKLAEGKQAEFSDQILLKEKQYNAQMQLALKAENRAKEEQNLRERTEKVLITLREERQELEKEVQSLRSQVESISTNLQNYKLESERSLKADLETSHQKINELTSQIAEKERELLKQVQLAASTEEVSRQHWERREELEKELANLKYMHGASIVEFEDRIKKLQKDHRFELQRLEAVLASTKEHAQVQLLAFKQSANDAERELKRRLDEQEVQHKMQIAQLREGPTAKEREMDGTIQSLTLELKQHQIESQRQIVAAKQSAEAEHKDIRDLLEQKELQLNEQARLAETAENRSSFEIELRMKLEQELDTTKENFEKHVAQWESRYNSLFESRSQALQKAEALLSRKEVDSRVIIDSLTKDFEAAKMTYAKTLKEKEQQHESTMEVQRAISESKLKKVREQLQDVSANYQKFKSDTRQLVDELTREATAAKVTYDECLRLREADLAEKLKQVQEASEKKIDEMQRDLQAAQADHAAFKIESGRALATEKEVWVGKLAELRFEIQQKENELTEQAAMTTAFRSTAEGLMAAKQRRRRITIQERDDLEKQLSTLRKQHQSEIAGWEAKHASLQHEMQDRERQLSLAAQVPRDTKESDEKLRASSEEAHLRQRELKSEIQALAVRHVMELQELEDRAKGREEELTLKVRSLEGQLQSFESRARESLEREKQASLGKQESLVAQIEQSQRQLQKILELYEQEKAKNKG